MIALQAGVFDIGFSSFNFVYIRERNNSVDICQFWPLMRTPEVIAVIALQARVLGVAFSYLGFRSTLERGRTLLIFVNFGH